MLALAFPSQAFGACPKDERLKKRTVEVRFFRFYKGDPGTESGMTKQERRTIKVRFFFVGTKIAG